MAKQEFCLPKLSQSYKHLCSVRECNTFIGGGGAEGGGRFGAACNDNVIQWQDVDFEQQEKGLK